MNQDTNVSKIFYKDFRLFINGSITAEEEPDIKCDCCGKHVSEIEPYNKEDDRWYLIKTWRSQGYYDEDGENWYGSSWECKDCVVLNPYEYFERRSQINVTETNASMK